MWEEFAMGDIYQTINFRVVPKIYWFPKRLGHVWVKIFEMPAPKTHGMDLCMYRCLFFGVSKLHVWLAQLMSKKLVSKFQHAWFLKIHALTTSMLKSKSFQEATLIISSCIFHLCWMSSTSRRCLIWNLKSGWFRSSGISSHDSVWICLPSFLPPGLGVATN